MNGAIIKISSERNFEENFFKDIMTRLKFLEPLVYVTVSTYCTKAVENILEYSPAKPTCRCR